MAKTQEKPDYNELVSENESMYNILEKYAVKNKSNFFSKKQIDSMERIFSMDIEDFKEFGTKFICNDGRFFFKDNGSKVLALAHLDSVQQSNRFGYYQFPAELLSKGQVQKEIVMHPKLDDRLGAWIILEYLKNYKLDILLTEGEENGRSTAKHFASNKEYNWVVEFDRTGGDVVLYHYENKQWKDTLKKYDFEIGQGSFSDICYVSFLGVKGLNIGVGYEDYHSKDSFARIDVMLQNLDKFEKFYKENYNNKFPHTIRGWTNRGFFDDDEDVEDKKKNDEVAPNPRRAEISSLFPTVKPNDEFIIDEDTKKEVIKDLDEINKMLSDEIELQKNALSEAKK